MKFNLGWDGCDIDSEQFVENLQLNLIDFQELDSTKGLFSISGTAAYFMYKLASVPAPSDLDMGLQQQSMDSLHFWLNC